MGTLTLQRFELEDIPRLISWIPDAPFLLQWAGPQYHFPLTMEQLITSLEQSRGDSPALYIFKAVVKSSSEVLGHIELMNIAGDQATATLARVLIGPPEFRNFGHGKEMVELALGFAFRELNLDVVDLGVFEFNTPAITLYRRLGFKDYKHVSYGGDLGEEFKQLTRMNLDKNTWLESHPPKS